MIVFQNFNNSLRKHVEALLCVRMCTYKTQDTVTGPPKTFTLVKTAYQQSHTHPSTVSQLFYYMSQFL